MLAIVLGLRWGWTLEEKEAGVNTVRVNTSRTTVLYGYLPNESHVFTPFYTHVLSHSTHTYTRLSNNTYSFVQVGIRDSNTVSFGIYSIWFNHRDRNLLGTAQ